MDLKVWPAFNSLMTGTIGVFLWTYILMFRLSTFIELERFISVLID
jgi:hypothetical protein